MMEKMDALEAILIAEGDALDRAMKAIVQICWIGFLTQRQRERIGRRP